MKNLIGDIKIKNDAAVAVVPKEPHHTAGQMKIQDQAEDIFWSGIGGTYHIWGTGSDSIWL